MNRLLTGLAALIALLLVCCAASADTVTMGNVSVDSTAAQVDFGSQRVENLQQLERFLDQLPNLTKCDMYTTNMTRAWAAELSEKYPQVEFGWTFRIPCTKNGADFTHIIRTDATAFSTLHNNQSPLHTAADFEVFKYCHHLLALDIGHNNVEDLSFLQYLPQLRVLIIGRNNNLTDISPLAGCPDLEYLEAFTCKIESVAPLLSCTHLLDLNIPNNRVRDPELLAQLTSLRRLWAFNCVSSVLSEDRVDSSVKSKVRSALPDCQIDWYSSGTGGYWRTVDGSDAGRKTPHYEVIYNMFQSGEYIPFEDSQPLREVQP